ncbi:MAG: hypothetical protein ACYS7Y_14320 [Planctomycetota bacterium]
MRNTVIEGVAVGVLVAGGIILALMMVAGESDEVQLVPKAQQTQATVWKSRDWPMFHGGQGLLGRAPGTLSDSLELVWKFETSDQIKS